MCTHSPRCPSPEAANRDAACPVASHLDQGWSLLCNGVIAFDDLGDLLPDGRAIPPRYEEPRRAPAANSGS